MRKQLFIRIIAFSMSLMLILSISITAFAGYRTIEYGKQGDDVRQMQSKLKAKGCYGGAVDGNFGSATKKAIIKYQKRLGITADGKPGNKTLTALYGNNSSSINTAKDSKTNAATNPKNSQTLYYGCSGSRVLALQRALKQADCYAGSVDGVYGDLTLAAVKKFQYKKGIHADGMAGAVTIRLLNKTAKVKIGTSFVLSMGSKGREVSVLQNFLAAEGRPCDGDTKGYFGKNTKESLKLWQEENGKKVTGTFSESEYNDYFITKKPAADEDVDE